MHTINPYTAVLTNVQIENLISKIRSNLPLWEINPLKTQIAFGHFIDGICLIYLDIPQNHFDELYGWAETHRYAKYAINEKGEFISFKIDGLSINGLERIVGNSKMYIESFGIKRCLDISGSLVSTQDIDCWKPATYSDKLKIFLRSSTTNIPSIDTYSEEDYFDDSFDDLDFEYFEESTFDIIDEEDDGEFISRKFISQGTTCSTLLNSVKLDTTKDTNYIINNRYLLLKDNIRNYFSEEELEYSDPIEINYGTYIDLFRQYNLNSDIWRDRYGVFDLHQHKTIIRCGEMTYVVAFINGFTRIDFNNEKILTFDFWDSYNNIGIPYRSSIEVSKSCPLIFDCITGRRFRKAQNEIHRYNRFQDERSGLDSGEWYILREGPYAGCTLYWMLRNNLNYVVYLIRKNYLFLHDCFKYDVFNSYDKSAFNRITLSLDLRTRFEDIEDTEQTLSVQSPLSQYRLCERIGVPWSDPTIGELIEQDFKYICILIKYRSLYIAPSVIEKLEALHSGESSYLKKLSKIRIEAENYEAERVDYENELRNKQQTDWDEYIIREANREFDDLMNDNDAWGNID